ncbi:MAG: phosphocholine cytidylyltransferase family protein [Actinobacteria bacterium]|nr:phosphocholine cytidylyltransferase family protein [Actinomycetota bacterium]
MKAIILAAGMGTRLGKYTQNLPKCMLEFKGKTLIERQIDTIRSVGISDITVIRGYMPEKIRIKGVKYYLNKDFANTNMVLTLFCAEKEMTEDILVLYSDILYEKKVLEAVLKSRVDIGVTVDTDYWAYWQARLDKPENDMESLVIDKEGKIIDLGNSDCTRKEVKVRYVGIIKFSKKGAKALKKVYHQNRKKYYDKDEPWLRSKSFKKAYMTCMLQALINAGFKVEPIYITHGWMEFDTVEDFEKAIKWDEEGTLKRFINLS